MNERIQLLYEQAHITREKQVIAGGWDNDREPLKYRTVTETNFDPEKFAQLIVQECISVSENHAKDLESQPSDSEFKYYDEAIVNGIYEATAAIKEHFSIK